MIIDDNYHTTQKLYAFLNRINHGEYFVSFNFSFISFEIYGGCHFKKDLSGCGIIAKCLPEGEHTAAVPYLLPFGLYGYRSVGIP